MIGVIFMSYELIGYINKKDKSRMSVEEYNKEYCILQCKVIKHINEKIHWMNSEKIDRLKYIKFLDDWKPLYKLQIQ